MTFECGNIMHRINLHKHHVPPPFVANIRTISPLKTMIADNDGIMDASNMFAENTKPVIKVNQLLFTTLCGLFSWSGLQQEGNKEVLSGKTVF